MTSVSFTSVMQLEMIWERKLSLCNRFLNDTFSALQASGLPGSDDYIDQLQYLRKQLTKGSMRDSVAIELEDMKSEDSPAKTSILDDDDSEDEAKRLKLKKAKKKAEKRRKAEQLRKLHEDVETMKENMHDLHDKLDRLLNLLEKQKEEKQKEEKKQEPVSSPPSLLASGIMAALGGKVEEKSD